MRQQEQINPAILVWARESAGLSVEEAAKKLALGDSNEESDTEKLIELERGDRLPSRNQLGKFAKTYRRPLVAFYMNAPRGRRIGAKIFVPLAMRFLLATMPSLTQSSET